MPLNPDFRDLFAALNAAAAEFLLVGGYALGVHAAPRFTRDLLERGGRDQRSAAGQALMGPRSQAST